jgi:competence protein ComEC
VAAPSKLPPNALTVVFFDAGQGDCALIVFPKGRAWMVDCGSTKNIGVVGPQIVNALKRLVPSGYIERLILTHADEDHYDLLPTLLDARVTFGQVTYGCALSLYYNKKFLRVYEYLAEMEKAGKTWSPGTQYFGGAKPKLDTIDGVSVYLLAAGAAGPLDSKDSEVKNGNSIVLLLEYGGYWAPTGYKAGYKIFLMGDALAATEKFILNNMKLPGVPADLIQNVHATTLKMGHHGSDTSSCQAWVNAIQPNGLVVSADAKRFGGVGMPKVSQLTNVLSWTTIAPMGSHPTVLFDDISTQRFKVVDKTIAFATTLNGIEYNTDFTEYTGSGIGWYWYVGSDGSIVVLPTP